MQDQSHGGTTLPNFTIHLPPRLQAVTDVLCPLLERRFGMEGAELAARAAQQLTAVERDVLEVGLPEQSDSRWLGVDREACGSMLGTGSPAPQPAYRTARLCHPPTLHLPNKQMLTLRRERDWQALAQRMDMTHKAPLAGSRCFLLCCGQCASISCTFCSTLPPCKCCRTSS